MFQSPPTSHRPFRDQRWSFPTRLSASWDDLVPSGPRGKPMDVYRPLDEQDIVNFRVFQNVGVMCTVYIYMYIYIYHIIYSLYIYIYMGGFPIWGTHFNHPELDDFSIETYGVGDPHFKKTPYIHIYVYIYIYG